MSLTPVHCSRLSEHHDDISVEDCPRFQWPCNCQVLLCYDNGSEDQRALHFVAGAGGRVTYADMELAFKFAEKTEKKNDRDTNLLEYRSAVTLPSGLVARPRDYLHITAFGVAASVLVLPTTSALTRNSHACVRVNCTPRPGGVWCSPSAGPLISCVALPVSGS